MIRDRIITHLSGNIVQTLDDLKEITILSTNSDRDMRRIVSVNPTTSSSLVDHIRSLLVAPYAAQQ
jgi:hypothetical protein